MVIRYIGLTEYNDIKKPININLGGPFEYEMEIGKEREWPYITVKKESPEYIYNFYKTVFLSKEEGDSPDFTKKLDTGVREISAIVGRNSAGKTSVLRMISNVLRQDKDLSESLTNYKYVMIHENIDEKQLYITTNIHNFYKTKAIEIINKSLIKYGFKPIKTLSEKAMLTKKQQIYFSGVFDKASPLQTASNLSDISTNKELNSFLINSRGMAPDMYVRDEFGIADFKDLEIRKRVALILKHPDLSTKNALMFDFPDVFKISLVDFEIVKLSIYDNYINENRMLGQFRQVLDNKRNHTRIKGRKTQNNLRNGFREELGYFLLEEVVLDSIKESNLSFEEVCERVWRRLSRYKSKYSLYMYADQIGMESFIQKKNNNEIYDNTEDEEIPNQYVYSDFVEDRISSLKSFKESLIESPDFLLDYDFDNDLRDELELDKSVLSDDSIDGLLYEYYDIMNYIRFENENDEDFDLDYSCDEVMEIIDQILQYLDDLKTISRNNEDIDTNNTDIDSIIKDINRKEKTKFYEKDVSIAGRESDKLKVVDSVLDRFSRIYYDFVKLSDNKAVTFTLDEEGKDKKPEGIIVAEVEYKKVRDEFFAFISHFIRGDQTIDTFDIVIDHEDVCSGYNGHFDMVSRLGELAEKIDEDKKELLIMVDEGELYLHPDAQKNFVLNFLKISSFFFKGRDIQLILSTNSPFILSDIPRTNILCLESLDEKGLSIRESDVLGKTFGTNITTLLINEFFMEQGVVGSYAKDRINEILYRLNNENYSDPDGNDKKIIDIIGDKLVSFKLEKMREEKVIKSDLNTLDREIKETEEKLSRLKKRKEQIKNSR